MAKFEDFDFKLNKSLKVIKICGKDVAVKQYLPAEDKNAILEIAMQQADQGTILNDFALDAIFHVYLVLKYTDIKVEPEQMENLFDLYDLFESNDVISAVVAAMPEEEYTSLKGYLEEMVSNYLTYRNSARALVEQLSFFAPSAAEKLSEVSQNVDIDKLKQIVQLADKTGANNGQ